MYSTKKKILEKETVEELKQTVEELVQTNKLLKETVEELVQTNKLLNLEINRLEHFNFTQSNRLDLLEKNLESNEKKILENQGLGETKPVKKFISRCTSHGDFLNKIKRD